MNHLWTGLWTGLVFLTALLLFLNYWQPPAAWALEASGATWLAFRETITWAVLYGILPAVLLGELLRRGATQCAGWRLWVGWRCVSWGGAD
jgi:hypothetical protein